MYDQFKIAAHFLREELANDGIQLGSSHSHAIVAAGLGFNSKKALIDASNDPLKGVFIDDENLALLVDDNELSIQACVQRMAGSPPIKKVLAATLTNLVKSGLAPACECCGSRAQGMQPVSDIRERGGWVCGGCLSDPYQYGHCRYCGDDTFYRVDDLNDAFECDEHDGEGILSDEEAEDQESSVEYLSN